MKRAALLVVCMALGTVGGLSAGKTPTAPKIVVGFSGQPGDGLMGDSYGNYQTATGVTAELQVNGNQPAWPGYSNLYLAVSTGGKNKRYLLFNYPAAVDVGCDSYVTGLSPTAANVKASGILNIHGVGAIAIGEVRAVRAYLFGPDGEFGWGGGGSQRCATNLAVYRPAWGTWYISTDVSRLGLPSFDLPGIEKNADGTPNCWKEGDEDRCSVMGASGDDDWAIANGGTSWLTPSPINQLGFTTAFLGNYSMPFALTVTSTDTRLKTNYVTCTKGGVAYYTGCSFPY